MGQFLNQIRKRLGLEPKRDKTLTGSVPNEIIISRAIQNEAVDPTAPGDRPVVLAPARMNPPTVGHGVLMRQVMDTAKQYNAPHHVILTRTHDVPKKKTGAGIKNPLTPEQKVIHARRFFPGMNIEAAHPDRPNLLSQASELHRQGHNHLVVVAGSDRVPEYEKLLKQYNGQEGKHGFYNFKKITVVPAGAERDPNATGAAAVSGTGSRKAAEAGDFNAWRQSTVPSHVSDVQAKQLFGHLRSGMGLDNTVTESSEGYPVPTIPTRNARDFIGKKSPLNKLPPPGKAGDIGKDADLDDGKEKTNFQLMRRRTKKRQLSVGFLEGYDEVSGIDAVDGLNRSAVFAPTTTPIKTSRINSKKIKAEGLFAADISNGDTGEGGNPNNSMDQLNPDLRGTFTKASKKAKNVREGLRDENPCWKGYEPVGTKKKNGKTVPNCVPKEEVEPVKEVFDRVRDRGIATNQQRYAKQRYQKTGVLPGSATPTADAMAKFLDKGGKVKKYNSRGEPVNEATYQGKTVPLNKPMKGDVKKSKVYVDPDGDGKAQKVNFGDKTLSIKKNIPARKKSYCARSGGQGNLTDKTSANYWSRRAWNCEEVEYDDGDDGYTQKAGKFHRGDRVKIKKDGYSGKANVDMYDPVSDTYLVSTDKQGSNLHVKAHEIEPIKESLTDRVKAIMEGKK